MNVLLDFTPTLSTESVLPVLPTVPHVSTAIIVSIALLASRTATESVQLLLHADLVRSNTTIDVFHHAQLVLSKQEVNVLEAVLQILTLVIKFVG